jgi:HEAT repeat protein
VFPEIVKAAKSKEWKLRDTALKLLHKPIGKSPEAVKIIKALLDDPNEFVRYQAHLSHFNATEDFSTYLIYLLETTSDINQHGPLKPDEKDPTKQFRFWRLHFSATKFYKFNLDRPQELAQELIANLSHKDVRVRQCALRQLRAMCISSHETYQVVLKAKPQARIQRLLDDKNEKVQLWAYLAEKSLEDGPPPDAPQKLKSLEELEQVPNPKPASEKM